MAWNLLAALSRSAIVQLSFPGGALDKVTSSDLDRDLKPRTPRCVRNRTLEIRTSRTRTRTFAALLS